MAVITQLPALSVIDSFRGVLDFYVLCRGGPAKTVCVRKWPDIKKVNMSPLSVAAQVPFSEAASAVTQIDADVQQLYDKMGRDTNYTWKDVAMSLYINGDKIYEEFS